MASAQDPIAILEAARRAALGYAHGASAGAVTDLMKRAMIDLKDRLKSIPASDKSFTATQMRATLKQVELVMGQAKNGLLGTVVTASQVVGRNSAQATMRYLSAAESQYGGVAGAGLGINTARVLDVAVSGTNASVLRRIATDPTHPGNPGVIDRYGTAVVGSFESILQTSLVTGMPWDVVRDRVTASSTFLQSAPLYWAERIVRTELMGAHNVAGNLALNQINDQTGGQLLRILCATFDDRTGSDSYAIHGQIRRMTEPFESWFGSFMTPPNRPNDREIITPHHIEWEIPENLKPKSDSEVAARWAYEKRKGSPPPRPLMTTVPLETIGKPAARVEPVAQAPAGQPPVGTPSIEQAQSVPAQPGMAPIPLVARRNQAGATTRHRDGTVSYWNETTDSWHRVQAEAYAQLPQTQATEGSNLAPGWQRRERVQAAQAAEREAVRAAQDARAARIAVQAATTRVRELQATLRRADEKAERAAVVARFRDRVARARDAARVKAEEAARQAPPAPVGSRIAPRDGTTAAREAGRAAREAERAARLAALQARDAAWGVRVPEKPVIRSVSPAVHNAGIAETRTTLLEQTAKSQSKVAKIPDVYVEAAQKAAESYNPASRPTGEPVLTDRKPISGFSGEAYGLKIEHLSAIEINAASQAAFGRPFDIRDFHGLMALSELKGAELSGAAVTGTKMSKGRYELRMRVNISNPGVSETAGLLERTYHIGPGGVTVHHDYFVMPQSLKNDGMGGRVVETQFATYRKLGVKKVETLAAWDGQYVWPSMGYRLVNPDQLSSFKAEFANWAQGNRPKVDKVGNVLDKPALPDRVATPALVEMLTNVQTLQDLALLEYNGVPVGKEFLRWRGHGHGQMINLELDLKTPASVKALETHFHERAKLRAAKKAAERAGATPEDAALAAKHVVVDKPKLPPKEVAFPYKVGTRLTYGDSKGRMVTGEIVGVTPDGVRVRNFNGTIEEVSAGSLST